VRFAVVCSRSIASVAKATAVSNPKQFVVPTMSLSIVFGTPTIGMPRIAELVRDRERAVAADGDSAPSPACEHLDHASAYCVGPSRSSTSELSGLPVFSVPRIVPPSRRMPVTSRGVSTRDALRLEQAVEAVFDAHVSMPLFQAALTTARMTALSPARRRRR
jgi:hypothetical protein